MISIIDIAHLTFAKLFLRLEFAAMLFCMVILRTWADVCFLASLCVMNMLVLNRWMMI